MLQLPIMSFAADTTAVPCTHNRCIALFPGHSQILYHTSCTYSFHAAYRYCVELQQQKKKHMFLML